MHRRIALLARKDPADEERILLCSPEVGAFTHCRPKDNLFAPGTYAGTLIALGAPIELVVPPGVAGRVVSRRPERVRHPVGYGDVLYELAPLESELATVAGEGEASAVDLAFRAPYSGRFWHRPAPGDPAFVASGDELGTGTVIGLIEVMKTFTHVTYSGGERETAGLPPRARLVRFLVEDGAEVDEGDALVEVEPA